MIREQQCDICFSSLVSWLVDINTNFVIAQRGTYVWSIITSYITIYKYRWLRAVSAVGEPRPRSPPHHPRWMLMGRRGGYVMAGDVCVICSAPSGSSVINLANQTNPDINYSNLIAGPSNLNAVFKHIQYFILPKCCLLCPIREIPGYYLYMFSPSDLCPSAQNWIFVMRKSGRERRARDHGPAILLTQSSPALSRCL